MESLSQLIRWQGKTRIYSWRDNKYGYRVIVINGLVYWAHRLAWFMYYERWPQHQIDHINMDPLDNRIENLRVATMTEQRANQRVRKDSKSGIKGVQKTRQGTWSARISKDGVTYRLGIFDAPEKAHIAYIKAAQTLFGKFARAA